MRCELARRHALLYSIRQALGSVGDALRVQFDVLIFDFHC